MTAGEAGAFALAEPPPDPGALLAKLLEGNKRFTRGPTSLLTWERPQDFVELAEGPVPSAVIVAYADSRVGPELIFDQGVGDLFVVRVAALTTDGRHKNRG
jgi:carbonic anhydrase